jgi:hypothetical protein
VRYRLTLDLKRPYWYHTRMEQIPNTVLQLIRKFDDQADRYRLPDYKEAQCRVADEKQIDGTYTTFAR